MDESTGEARYHLLETTRQYAREKLFESDEGETLRNQHLTYFLDLAEKGNRELRGSNHVEWLKRLNAIRENLRAALNWAVETGQTETALHLARKLHWFWFVLGNHIEGRQWLGRVLALPDVSMYPESHAEALTQLAHHTLLQIGTGEARPYVEQALTLAQEYDDNHNIARALVQLGLVLTREGDFAAGRSALEDSKALFRQFNDEWGYAHAVICLALGSFNQDDRVTALALNEQALALFRKLGDRYFESATLRFIGILQVKQGDVMRGMAALRESLLLAQQLDSKWEIAAVLWRLGEAVQHAGNPERAVCLLWAAKNVFDSIGAWHLEDDSDLENELAPCRAALGESEFAKAVEQGRAMTMEQAIEYALEDTNE